jgi:hypothetical protein
VILVIGMYLIVQQMKQSGKAVLEGLQKLEAKLEGLKPKAGFANPNWWYGVHDGLGQSVNDIMQGRGYGSEQGREGARTIGNEGYRVDMGRVQMQVPGGGEKKQTETQGWG